MNYRDTIKELNEMEEEKHLRDFIKKVDYLWVVNDIDEHHFSTDEVIDEQCLREDEDDIEIYPEENLLNLSDDQLLQIPEDRIHGFTNTELLDRFYKLDKTKLSANQIAVLTNYYEVYRAVIDKEDLELILDKLKKCSEVYVEPTRKNREFMVTFNISNEDVLSIVKQLTVSDYVGSRKSFNAYHLGDNLLVFEPTTVIVNDEVMTGVIIYMKINVDMITGDVGVLVSCHSTNHRNQRPYSTN
ncbi:MAG: hypothetical protein IJM79_01195 [Erysipelotrichaceae bacterium]|nr:hypothetical protein [Erysipelotrichaceae bacterium]